jgi:hypothetical protein
MVSVVAVFLALGLGILLGSSVVSTPIQAQLNANLEEARDQRNSARQEASEARDATDALTRRIGSEVAPWALQGRLVDRPVVIISDAASAPSWREHVLDAVGAAGAKSVGTLLFGERLALDEAADRTELVRTVQAVVPGFTPASSATASAEVLALLGERFTEPTGRTLVTELVRANFLTLQGGQDSDWPPPDSVYVMLSATRPSSGAGVSGAAGFVTAIGKVAPVLVVSNAPDDRSLVSELRGERGLPEQLATFDAATNESDPGGIGIVAALLAATEGRGGHFGLERGRPFIAPPAPPP